MSKKRAIPSEDEFNIKPKVLDFIWSVDISHSDIKQLIYK